MSVHKERELSKARHKVKTNPVCVASRCHWCNSWDLVQGQVLTCTVETCRLFSSLRLLNLLNMIHSVLCWFTYHQLKSLGHIAHTVCNMRQSVTTTLSLLTDINPSSHPCNNFPWILMVYLKSYIFNKVFCSGLKCCQSVTFK